MAKPWSARANQKKWVNKLSTSLGQSLWDKTDALVLSTALCNWPWALLKTWGPVISHNFFMDSLHWYITYIYWKRTDQYMHISQTYNRDRDCKITICYAVKKKTVNLSLYCVWKKEKILSSNTTQKRDYMCIATFHVSLR